MKTKLTFLSLWIFCLQIFAQDSSFDLLKNSTSTKILYDRVFAVSKATQLKTDHLSSANFLQVYHEIQRADFLRRLPELSVVQKKADEGFIHNFVPLSLLITDFENIKPESLENGQITRNAKDLYQVNGSESNVYEKHQLSLLAPIVARTKDRNVRFLLSRDLVFNTTNRVVSSIKVEQGSTWKDIDNDEFFTLNFLENGSHTVRYKIQFTNGDVLSQSFVINVQYQKRAEEATGSKAFQPNVVTSISSVIPYKGYGESTAFTGKGEYEIFMGNDGVLDKPIILVDGFDPGDTRNTAGIYQMLSYGSGQNLGDQIRQQGYDIIVLNFPIYTRPDGTTIIDGGVDYIQRNAMILVELLKQVNAQKSGNVKNVVIGPSMGGLISRYALRYMEQNAMNPDTRVYLSFDSPHLGANVPLGFQHLFNYMGYGPLGDVTMQQVVNGMLKSPAAREMLLDHFEGHLKPANATEFDPALLLPAGAPNYRDAFQSELNAMGFPTSTRNVAISNGAGNGATTGTPGMTVIDHTFNTSSTQRAIIKLNFTPTKNTTAEVSNFKGQQWILFWISVYNAAAKAKSPSTSDGLDAAPGGRFDVSKFADVTTGNPLLSEFMSNLNIMYFNFIPAVSSLAVSNNAGNYYSNINASSVTPFAAYHVPNTNQNHVTLDQQNVLFALNEILLPPTMATGEHVLSADIMVENPVKNSVRIKTSKPLRNVEFTITDVSGRKIYITQQKQINSDFEFSAVLAKGSYLLTISYEGGKITKKLMKD
ncbi:MAG: hypothetical protein BGO40_12490 [Chryseobacterium sp. 39-10]|nr:T9SS type A sorting domain-containing protein [Chryseobacterium sp.]OJV48629.1 MAG: hypothetical protein BGO40_12490 [Chryseobacterium sp. 39-10]